MPELATLLVIATLVTTAFAVLAIWIAPEYPDRDEALH